MGSHQVLFLALLVIAVAFDQRFVAATFSKSMSFNWGASHSSILGNGDDLELVLDPTSGMRVYSSIWNADNWATRGGLVKIDWNSAPFVARFRHFRARACKWNGPVSIDQCASISPANWWTSPVYSQLSYGKKGQMKWVRENYMIYDYCKDTKRFQGNMPPECFKPQF